MKKALIAAALATTAALAGCQGDWGSIAVPKIGEAGLITQQDITVKGIKFNRTCITAAREGGGFSVNCDYTKIAK